MWKGDSSGSNKGRCEMGGAELGKPWAVHWTSGRRGRVCRQKPDISTDHGGKVSLEGSLRITKIVTSLLSEKAVP